MPIIGTIASSRRAFTIEGSMEPIAVATVPSGGLASITFGNIPQTYTHLQVRGFVRNNTAIPLNTIVAMNGDTGNNYSAHYIVGNGATVTSAGEVSRSGIYVDITTNTATSYSAWILDILDYTNTNKNKTVRSLAGLDMNGSGTIWLASGAWLNTSAITSLLFTQVGGNAFAQFSSFALYGIKGA